MTTFKKSSFSFILGCILQIGISHQTLASNLLEHEKNNIEIYNNVAPSVVLLKVSNSKSLKKYGTQVKRRNKGVAAGVIWDNNGHIVTNFHNIRSSQPKEDKNLKIKVFFWNHDPLLYYNAYYVGGDPINDIAVLKLKVYPIPLNPIQLGSSADLQVGQEVFSIGHPLQFQYHMSKGIISGMNSGPVIATQNLIFTDAFMAMGSSGGPLVNTSGEMVGMNTALLGHIVEESGLSMSISLAIPIDQIRGIVEYILENNP